MNENRKVQAWSAIALAAVVTGTLPLAAACGGSNAAQANAGGAASMGYGQPPPGYSGQPAYGQQYGGQANGAQTSAPPGYPGVPAYTAPPAGSVVPPGYASAAPSASQAPLAPTDPSTLQQIVNGIQGALSGNLVAPGGADAAEAGLRAQAARVAPGMQPEGDELKQTMTEGQHSVVMFNLQAGKCYAIVGYSPAGGVKDLDLNLLAPPFYNLLAGQDLTHNPTPVIGGAPSPMCPLIAFPLQYKLDVFAKSGSGPVAVQLYSKTK